MSSKIEYTCKGKGGRYEILGLATGAGLTRGEDRLIYKDASTGRLFLRTESDFSERMERLQTVAAPVVEPNKCGQCAAATTDICNQNGCGFLESGNAAPVVERQLNQCDGCRAGIPLEDGNLHAMINAGGYRDVMACTAHLYAAPPELAELQATIANLTTDLKVTKQALESLKGERVDADHREAGLRELIARASQCGGLTEDWHEAIAKLTAETERLKGGQGEPVAWLLDGSVGGSSLDFQITDLLETQNRYGGCLVPLYTSQPAPVSVVHEPTPYQPKGNWSFEPLEGGEIVIRNGKDWTVIKSGDGPIYEQFLYRFCEQQMKALTAPVINENAEFEKWRNAQIDVLTRNGYPEGAEAFRNLGSVQWAGWQARACLDKVKELNQ